MIFKWNIGQKRALNTRKKDTKHSEEGASAPHAPPRYTSGPSLSFNKVDKLLINTFFTEQLWAAACRKSLIFFRVLKM